MLDETGLRTAQLHGDESPRFARELGVPVIKTFDTFNDGSLEKLKKYDAFAFLLDLPKGGGAGARAQVDPQWAVLAKRHGKVLLAGKLTADNVGTMIRKVRPWGVDVCSATEKSPGIKDRAKLRDFIRSAREAFKETTRISAGWINSYELATGKNELPAKLPAGTTPTQLAAYTVVSRVLLNLDETITKE